jgi:hypothetical protein
MSITSNPRDPVPKRTKTVLKAEFAGGVLVLRCPCGLQIQQPPRDAIAPRCPRCSRWWR